MTLRLGGKHVFARVACAGGAAIVAALAAFAVSGYPPATAAPAAAAALALVPRFTGAINESADVPKGISVCKDRQAGFPDQIWHGTKSLRFPSIK